MKWAEDTRTMIRCGNIGIGIVFILTSERANAVTLKYFNRSPILSVGPGHVCI